MKLLIDMNLSPRWVVALEHSGIESTHWSSVGAPNAEDSEIMLFAKVHGFVVLTHDLDFSSILAANHGEKPCVVQIRAENLDISVIGPREIAALLQMNRELEEGALITVDPRRTRIRILPL